MGENKCTAEMVDRKEGYYWVSFGSKKGFEIAKWWSKERSWTINNEQIELDDSDFKEIDEKQICRS